MKVLFVYPNLMRQEYLPIGLAILSAYLKREGHEIALVDHTWGGKPELAAQRAAEFKPDVVGFSLRSGEFDFSAASARAVKKAFPESFIVFGGVHATVAPQQCIAVDAVDAVCVGEGEEAFAELLAKMRAGEDYFGVRNFWFKNPDGSIQKNELRPLIENLDSLPYPDRDLFDFSRYLKNRSGAADVMAGRGCPFSCTYCINHVLQKLYAGKGRYVRMRGVDNVLGEIRELRRAYGDAVRFIAFEDDTFTFNQRWVLQFSERYASEFKIPFSCNARAETMTPEVAAALKRAGCNSVNIGVESGNEKLRREVLRRTMSNEQIRQAFRNAHEAGLHTASFNMVGLPFESEENMRETIALNKEVQPDFVDVSVFQPYPGTELHDVCEREGWLKSEKLPFSHKFYSILDYPNVSRKTILSYRQKFRYEILKDSNWKRALFVRFLDSNYELYTKVRNLIPSQVKSAMFALLRK